MNTVTEVKERPILFSTPMVKAILEGRKTVTRRVVTARNSSFSGTFGGWPSLDFSKAYVDGNRNSIDAIEYLHVPNPEWETSHRIYPKYDPKDILWVRETWRPFLKGSDTPPGYWNTFQFKAGGEVLCPLEYELKFDDYLINGKWKPSIHMPRAACRLRLEIVSIGVERLHDITEEDAKRECAPMYVPGHGIITQADVNSDPGYLNFVNYRMGFEHLWMSINGPESWNANPWIWRIEFRKAKI